MASPESNFMECPLVIWVDTFRSPGSARLQYSDLYNGVFLCDVMQAIDARPAYQNVVRTVRDVNIRIQNWDVLMKNIRAYYSDVLQQLLIVKLPNIQVICKEPEKDASFSELKKVLLLILGCAVQCERKEEFIKVIMDLEVSVQQEIVESIKQITDDNESVLQTDCQDPDKLFRHLVNVIAERNEYAEMVPELTQERDYFQAQSEGKATLALSSTSGSPEKNHIVVELTDCKARIRKLKQDLDDKQEQLSDIKEECDEHKASLTKLRNENVELLKDARSARALRDELDILREKIGRVNNYEAELLKCKEKLNEMEFYKTRVEELREDNAILLENRSMLEEQLASSHKRIETVVQLEKELVKYRQQIEEMSAERDDDRERMRILAEENAQLQLYKKVSMNENTSLEQEMQAAKAKFGAGGAISDQLKETTNAKILRLELENQHLLRKIEDIRESSLIENTNLNLQLEKENQRLAKKMEKLQQENKEMLQKYYDFEEKNRELCREKEQILKMVEITKENGERQIKEYEQQNDDLKQTLDVIRNRNEQTNDTKLKYLEKENKKLHETISVKNQMLTKLEFNNKQLQKTYQRTQDNLNKLSELENEKDNLERENMNLQHRLQALELACEKVDKLEQEYSDKEVEIQKLQNKIQNLQTIIQKKDKLEQDHINLTVENQKLQRMLDNVKHSASAVAELENENSLLKKELQQLQRVIQSKAVLVEKLEKMELDLMDLDNENLKLQRQLESTTNRLQHLEKDNSELEAENEKLQEQTESAKVSQKRMTELEKGSSEMEKDCLKYQKEISQLTKENRRNKVSLEARESAINDLNTKYSLLELSHKELKRTIEEEKSSGDYIKDMEKEHKELIKNLQTEKQTVLTLRTDLVNEKIKTQELTNKLEKLHQDLERLGVNKDKLMDTAQNENRFKALESMMEDALNKSLTMKEDKIQALENRLEESKNRNLKLQDEMRVTKREFESLKQQFEEESHGKERERQESHLIQSSPLIANSSTNQTSHMVSQTSHLVKLERDNATLLVENDNLKSHTNSLNEQIKKLESQNSQLLSNNTTTQTQTRSLQSQNAKLQVENATLKAQCNSLQSQNSHLQNQLSNVESSHSKLDQLYRDLQRAHNQLTQDQNALHKIHDESTAEYEALISEHGSLKSVHKTLKNENRGLQQQINNLLHVKDDDSRIKEWLANEREQLQMEKKSLGNLQMNYNKLKDDHDRLLADHDKLKVFSSTTEKEKQDVNLENKNIKDDYNLLQQDIQEYKEKIKVIENNFNILADKYDSLFEVYQKTWEDKEQLLKQVEILINKNQELLTHLLSNKDQMAGKEKTYMEQVSDLRRQKERLEEKIMEHYKTKDKQKKNKSFAAMLLQKMRGLKRSKSRPNLLEPGSDISSLGSGSYVETDGDMSKKSDDGRNYGQSGSLNCVTDDNSPHSLTINKVLAKSTTALYTSPGSDRYKISCSGLRGARSSEDLLSDTICSHGDNVSTSNHAFMLLPGMGKIASDDEGGFRKSVTSPTAEFLTLEEFLAEGLVAPSPQSKRKMEVQSEDTESRSSDNSDGSVRPRQAARMLPANNYSNNHIGSIPDVAAVDVIMPKMSRASTGNSSGHDIRPESAFNQLSSPYHVQPNNTSTPAKCQASHRPRSFEDLNNSAFSRIHGNDDKWNKSNYESIISPLNSSQLKLDYNDTYSVSYQGNQEPKHEHDKVTDTRLDALTRNELGAFSSASSQAGNSPQSNYSSPGDQRSRLQESDLSIRSGHGSLPQQNVNRSPQSHSQTPSSGQRPVKATRPVFPQNQSPGNLSHSLNDRNMNSPQQTPQRKANILVSRATIGPKPYGPNSSRSRPVSAFGTPTGNSLQNDQSLNSSLNNLHSSRTDLSLSISNQNHSVNEDAYGGVESNTHSIGPVQSSYVDNHSAYRVERPKSVPPTMFQALQGNNESDSSHNNEYTLNHDGNKGLPPAVPPRKGYDNLTKYNNPRDPNSPLKSSPGTTNRKWSNVQPGNSSAPRPQAQVPSGPKIGSSQNVAQTNPSGPRLSAAKPTKPEEVERKENSVWTATQL